MLNNLFRMIKLKSLTLGKELLTTSSGHVGEEIHDVLMLEQFGFASVPPVDSEGIAFMPDAYSENAVTAFFDSPQHKPDLLGGEACLYDAFGNSVILKNGLITINAVNNLNIVVNGACNLNANSVTITAPTTTVSGNLVVTGNLTASGNCTLGGSGGQAIARVGDTVVIGGQSGTITTGSAKSSSN